MDEPGRDDRRVATDPSDEEIVERVRAGDREAFEILLERHQRAVYRSAQAVARNPAEAEEIAQEAWVRAFGHLDQFAGRGPFVTWVTRIAVREAWLHDRLRRRWTSLSGSTSPEISLSSATSDPERSAAQGEMLEAIDAAIRSLPEKFRVVLVLREIDGLSTAEAAGVLKTSGMAVKTRLYRARRLLRSAHLKRLDARDRFGDTEGSPGD